MGFNIYFLSQFKVLNEIAQSEVQILDLRFGYTLEEVKLFFEQIGSEGQLLYAKISKADMLYPISYGLFIVSLLSFFSKGKAQYLPLNILPIFAVVVDWVENNNISKLNLSFPNLNAELVEQTALLTQTKWVLIALSILMIVFLLIKRLIKKN